MSSVSSISSASGLAVISVAQAKSQNLLDTFTPKQQAQITSAKSFVMTLSSSGFHAAIISNDTKADATLTSGKSPDYAAYYTKYDGMSSNEWSSMLYAGGSVLANPEETTSNTLQGYLTDTIKADEDFGTHSDAAINQQALTAFNNKALTIQKASDVAGLDWNENISWSAESGGKAVEQGNTTYNQGFINANIRNETGVDGKHHEIIVMGPTSLYLSW